MTRRTSLAAIAATLIAAGSLALAVLPGAAAIAATACTNGSLSLVHKGQLTVATDAPAYPPYFENNKPANGQGFESAIAYGVGHELGFSSSQVKWTQEQFNDSYAPGPKSFDFDINEISITAARAKAVDFSTPYYNNPEAIVVIKGSKFQHVGSLAAMRSARFGVQVGTTSLSAVTAEIHPTSQTQVFNSSNDVISALRDHLVDAIVVDLATAFELTSGEIPHGVIAGQFNAPGGGD